MAGSQKVTGSSPVTSTIFPRHHALTALVFFAGIGSMATEICASRLLAPYYGSSTAVWANIIGLILAALSLGYWFGGRLADRHPSATLLATIVIAAAALIARANAQYDAAQAALRAGDLAAFARQIQSLGRTLAQLKATQ